MQWEMYVSVMLNLLYHKQRRDSSIRSPPRLLGPDRKIEDHWTRLEYRDTVCQPLRLADLSPASSAAASRNSTDFCSRSAAEAMQE
jgi:hypothetical protein